MSHKSKDYKTMYQFTGGVAANVLIKHQLTARLDNFSIDGKEKFQINNTGYEARAFTMQLNLGFKVIHKLDKEKVPLLITANDEAVSKSKEETKSILDTCLKSTEMLLKLEAASAAACSLKMPLLIGNVNGQWDPCVWRDLVTQLNIPEKSKDVMKSEGQKALFLLAERIGPELMKRMIISQSFLRSRRF